ncbi:hypothetical protein [Vibrio neonatus]|uniref:hypothetical protein n=1 Tax=Vibrio neonatus TaxID=278860 RepID=UPI0021C4B2BD|nr:hypothetical protein [Vibrio neonatus]
MAHLKKNLLVGVVMLPTLILTGCGGSNTPTPKKVEVTNPDQAELINNMVDAHNDSIPATALTPAMAYPEKAPIVVPPKVPQKTPDKIPTHCLVSQPAESQWTIYNLRVADEKLASEYADYTDATGIAYRGFDDICQAFALPVTSASEMTGGVAINQIGIKRFSGYVSADLTYEKAISAKSNRKLLISVSNYYRLPVTATTIASATQDDGTIRTQTINEFAVRWNSNIRGFEIKTGTVGYGATSFTRQAAGGYFQLMDYYVLRSWGDERPEIKALISGQALGDTAENTNDELRRVASFLDAQVSSVPAA